MRPKTVEEALNQLEERVQSFMKEHNLTREQAVRIIRDQAMRRGKSVFIGMYQQAVLTYGRKA